ncbi:MAG: hypothetical protein KAG84_05390 [Bacteroidales bacterium]|nr:hypothetical protein [Bacteroidales bacterium]
MEIIEKIKSILRKRKSKRILGNGKRVLHLKELKDVKSVGIVFDASTEDLYRRAAHLVRHFASMHKEVRSIAVTNTEVLPPYVDNTLSFNYILKKEINWIGVPKNKYVDIFIHKDFDLLINLDFSGNKSLVYIVNASIASLKMGINNDDSEIELDFMFEGIKDNDLGVFLKEMLKYLEMIKTK